MKLTSLFLTSAVSLILSQSVSADELKLQKTEQLTLAAGQLAEFVIEAGAGSMEVNTADVDNIEVIAKIYQYQPHDDYCLRLIRQENQAYLQSATCRHSKETMINLTIRVPEGLPLDIEDGSGLIKLSGIAGVKIVDGSGAIEVSNIKGSLDIKDGSGLISAKNIQSFIKITDGSGEIKISTVTGDVTITDGSGAIELDSIVGNVVVSDGSGAIEIESVEGAVEVSDGSGNIEVSQAQRFELLSDGSGKVDVSDISGEVIMNGYGR